MILALGASLLKSNIPINFIITDEIWSGRSESIAKANFYKYFPDCKTYSFKAISVANESTRELAIDKDDIFIATAWWTVHSLKEIFVNEQLKNNKIFYLIQDFEPGFYPWGAEYALAIETYKKDIIPIYSTISLKNYFQKEICIRKENEECAVYFPEISKKVFYPNKLEYYKSKRVKKLFCYVRPSIPRNMYQLLIQSLIQVTHEGIFPEFEWEFWSGGENHEHIELGKGHILKSKGKLSYLEYGEFLRTCDLGISLMYSPHPSYPPFEMAQSGIVTITNLFPGKDLSTTSKNIISCETNLLSLNMAIKDAFSKHEYYEKRMEQSILPFPDVYEDCFSEPVKLIKKYHSKSTIENED